MKHAALTLAVFLSLAACAPKAPDGPPRPNAAGLVPLPCGLGSLRPFSTGYCIFNRNFVTPQARDVAVQAAAAVAKQYPGLVVHYMDASGPDGHRPFAPHLSHGDGREIDLALFYTGADGHPMFKPPGLTGYRNYEPPRPGDPVMCAGQSGGARDPDPPVSRHWRLDEARTKALVEAVTRDPRVKRVFLEPHLKLRLGLRADGKIHFQGCRAARHDDHLHVDVL